MFDFIIFTFLIVILFLTCAAMYFLPSVIAFVRNHPHKIAVLVLNLLTGATGIGWIAAFIWAFIDFPIQGFQNNRPSVAHEIKELSELKEQGILTEDEFETRKKKLLES